MQNQLQGFQLSPQQRRLLPLQQDNPAFRAQLALRLEGALDAAALRRGLEGVVRRHEILRTVFQEEDGAGSAVQAVADAGAASWETFDLGGVEPGGRAAEVERRFEEALRVPFDLAAGPVVRASLLRLDDAEHVLILSLPALCADSRTLQNLTAELARAYADARRGEQPPDEATQYVDFSEWQNSLLDDEDARAGRKFWREKCAGGFPPLALPLELPRRGGEPFRPDALGLEADARVASALDALARQRGLSAASFLLACWQALLWRLTGQASIAVGYACDGRRYEDLRDALGLFARWLPLACSLDGERRFAEVWRRAEDDAREASDWQEYFTWETAGVADGEPLPLAAGFRYEERAAGVEAAGVKFSALRQYDCAEQFKVNLSCVRRGDGLTLELQFRPDLISRRDAERLARRFHTLVHHAVEAPDAPLRRLSVLPPEERHELLHAFDATRSDAESSGGGSPREDHATLHELFERQAARAPDAPALTFEGDTLTYAELDRRADRLARRLVASGVRPDSLVGLLMGRSLEMVVAILGVLKAGGAYVPLDPDYPADRLSFMLEDSAAPVIVTQEHLKGRLPDSCAARVVMVGDGGEHGEGDESGESPRVEVPPDSLAYVIYTSGSTGRPKGVGVTHANVARLFAATGGWFGFGGRDVWTLFHSYAFDFSVWEVWGALLYGGRLVVVPYLVSRSPEEFHALVVRERVTVLNQTPSAFRQLTRVDEERAGAELALRYVVFGGEALELSSLGRWFARRGDRRPQLVNMYGITETTVHVTYEPVGVASAGARDGASPIGRPIPDLRVYVLDEWMELSPVGVAGELYVGGAGVARGYLNRPDLTAERFVPDPFSAEPGARLYRTGDVGRYVGGRLEYVGRVDQQVKIRGFRVEPGEIEAALLSHAGVREAVVSARGDDEGQKRLVAYFVAAEGSGVTAGELRRHLSGRLPEYMLPAGFVRLDALPLTPSGKIDKRALPEPGGERPELAEGYEPPAGEEEQALAEVWAEVLGVGRVGANDNFFALGGDSIRSVRLVALAKERGLSLSVEDVFRHQTVRELAGVVAGDRPESAESAAAVRTVPFELVSEEVRRRLPADVEDAYPLTMLQAGMLYHIQLTPDADAAPYHNVTTWLLRAPFDSDALAEAVRRVVARHPVLRTSFDFTGYGEPLQLVHREATLRVAVEDLRGLRTDEQEALVASFMEEENRRPFDFARPPLLRMRVHRRTDDTFQFTITEHHAIFDGWSLTSTLTEIFTLYLALVRGESPAEEPPPAVSFRDFVKLERMAVESEECARYWAEKLSDADVLRLPRWPARLRGAGATVDTPKRHVPLPDDVSEGLRDLAQSVSAPLKSVLLAAHLKVLSLVSGQRDVLTGLSVNGRPEDVDGERVRGLFLNTVPLRVATAGGTWADLVRRTFEAEREMLPFRRYPMALLQNQYGRQGLFEVLFAYLHFHSYERLLRRAGDFEVLSGRDLSKTNFPLNVIFQVNPLDPSRLGLTFQYDAGELAAAQVEQFGDYYLRVLSEMARAPFAPHEDAPLLPPEELERQLVRWNATRTDYPQHSTIQQLFEEQAAATPDAPAVTYEGETLTYGQLNRRANQLAHRLRSFGVASDTPVGVLFERSSEMIVAVLGVLKAGGAYVPLDPHYPQERLRLMLDDSRVSVLLTASRWLDALPHTWAHVVRLDEDWPDIAREPEDDPPHAGASPEDLAYVSYTSGSTGVPKGVAVTHRGVARLVRETNYADFDAGQVFLQFAPLTFDASTLEIWGALLNGGRLVVMSAGQPSLAELGETLRREGVTTLWLTAGLFHLMVDERLEDLLGLRQMLAGGDVLSPAHVRKFLAASEARGARAKLINGYGPTENTTFTCCHVMRSARDAGETSVPVGRPIANTRVYVLDERMRPVAVGATGELYTGGDGLARGYLNRPDLTAERFVPDPFSETPGARLYRTGDLARLLPDGLVEFVGRADQQVKIRGFRIEPGEIEEALRGQRGVAECVVVAREDEPGEKHLVAYVVPEDGAAGLTTAEWREQLRASLPDFMVPSAFVTLDALPLTANGKVDRKALPAPDHARDESGESYTAPRTPTEEIVAGIWSEVLGLERVGVHDNFFDLGGHSLLATQAVARLPKALGVDVPLAEIFELPTVALLSAAIDARLRAGQGLETPPIERAPRDEPLPLSFAQRRLWLFDQLEPNSPAYNMPFAVRLEGSLDVPVFERALGEVVRRHEALRTTFKAVGGEPVQVVSPPSDFHVPVRDLGGLAEAEREEAVRKAVREEANRPFDLAAGPLLRATLLRVKDDEHVLLLVMHHIVSDGWSMGVLVREVATLYAAFAESRPSPLSELPIQYADYAAWQRGWLRGEVLERQLGYWRERLGDGVPALELPADRPRPAVPSFRGATETFALSREASQALQALSRREGATLFMTLLAAFKALLARYTGQEDIAVGTPIANRNHPGVQDLIGFFVNTLVLRTDLSGDPTFRELLARVRAEALGAYAHQDLPFDRLVEELQPDRYLSAQPFFQVMFAVQNAPTQPADLPGLTLSLLKFQGETAKFDLLVGFTEREDGLTGSVEYSTDIFDRATVERMCRHLRTLVEAAAADPEARLSALPLLDEAERRRVLEEWNDTARDYPRDTPVHELFERQAAATPDAVAVVCGDVRLTYRELDERSDRLANFLRARGVGPEVLVGVCLERDAELIAVLLGILKAGGAYVPLDPTYPKQRLRLMLEDARVSVLLTEEHLLEGLREHAAQVVCLASARAELERAGHEKRPSGAGGDNLAYVIYTSGSTGVPKGVAVTHAAVNRLVCNTDYVRLAPGDRVAQASNSSFDAATFEIWGALLNGARAVVVSKEVAISPREFAAELRARRINTLFLTTALFNELAREVPSAFSGLKHLLFGGEAVEPKWVREVLNEGPPERLLHVYGPTESTTFSTWQLVGDVPADARTVPIGRPIANTESYVLDRHLRPVPVGLAGELYVGGDGLARGYLNSPALTAGRFVPHPYSSVPGARLYKTGDLVRLREDGAVEFVGRADQQVKLRGFRIELGEIEAVLGGHKDVRDCVVLAREDGSGERRLVGYVVADADADEAALFEELRGALRASLPEYMTPSAFVRLDSLPLTPNGKVDKRALPEPGRDRPELRRDFVAPRDETEERMAAIWAEVLQVERVGVHDNFFELGGHSLLATQIISRVREVFAAEIPVRRLFETPTVAGLSQSVAARASQAAAAAEAPGPRAIPRRGRSLDDQLAELDLLSPEEVEALLGAEGEAGEGRRAEGGGPR